MKEIFTVLLSTLLLIGCGKKEVAAEKKAEITFISESGDSVSLEREDLDIFFSEKNDPRIDDGKLEIRDPSSSISVEYKIRNGFAHGRCTTLARINGEFIETGYTYYKNGIEHGEAIMYHEGTAIILQSGQFEDGKAKDIWMYYDRKSNLRMLLRHNPSGELTEIITYDENRSVLLRGGYKENHPYEGYFPASIKEAVSQLYYGSSYPVSVSTYKVGQLQETNERKIFEPDGSGQ